MSGVSIQIEWDTSQVNQLLNKLVDPDLRDPLDAAGLYLVGSIQQRFSEGVSPSGERWAKGSHLTKDGHLKSSMTYHVSNGEVEVGTNVIYAAIHNFGGVIKAKNGKALAFNIGGKDIFVKSVTMPQREFMGFSSDDKLNIEDIFTDWAEGLIT